MTESQQYLNALPTGFRLRQYELDLVLGAGGFGITYRGHDHTLDRLVAIKEYLPGGLAVRQQRIQVLPKSKGDRNDFEWGLDSFVDEAKLLARFNHPNIVSVHDHFEANGTAYIVMEYVRGETLLRIIERKGRLPPAEFKAVLFQLLDGIEQVHAARFLHRDIKPDNIICRQNGSPVLLDFGAARQATSAKTLPVTVIIAPGYSPIEQYSSSGKQGPWTDIYALGAVAYRAVTGQKPPASTERVGDDHGLDLSTLAGDRWDTAFLTAIEHALAVHAKDRPRSVAEWRTALQRADESAPGKPQRPGADISSGEARRDARPPPSIDDLHRAISSIGTRLFGLARRLAPRLLAAARLVPRRRWFATSVAAALGVPVAVWLLTSDPDTRHTPATPPADPAARIHNPPPDPDSERVAALKRQMVAQISTHLERGELGLAEGLLDVAHASWPNEPIFSSDGDLSHSVHQAIGQRSDRDIAEMLDLVRAWRTAAPGQRRNIGAVLGDIDRLSERYPGNAAIEEARLALRTAFADAVENALETDPPHAERLLAETPPRWSDDDDMAALSGRVRDATTKHTVRQLIADGEESLRRDRLTLPTGNNAVRHFTDALRLEPGNQAALAGLERVQARLVRFVRAAILDNDADIARRHLTALDRLDAAHPDIPALRSSIDQLDASRSAAAVANAANLLDEEDRLWNSVKDSCREGDLDLYCDAYPDGRYKDQCAERRLACLILRAQEDRDR